jgi:hypothetical protein
MTMSRKIPKNQPLRLVRVLKVWFKGVFKSNGAIENEIICGGVFIKAEITLTHKLEAFAYLCIFEGCLKFAAFENC